MQIISVIWHLKTQQFLWLGQAGRFPFKPKGQILACSQDNGTRFLTSQMPTWSHCTCEHRGSWNFGTCIFGTSSISPKTHLGPGWIQPRKSKSLVTSACKKLTTVTGSWWSTECWRWACFCLGFGTLSNPCHKTLAWSNLDQNFSRDHPHRVKHLQNQL